MKKRISLIIILLFLGMTISSAAEEPSLVDDDLDVKISASAFGTDIGFSIRIDLKNNREYNLTVYVNDSFDRFIFNFRDGNHSIKKDVKGNSVSHVGIGYGFSLTRFTITVEGGNTKVMREGFQLIRLYILLE